MDVTLAEVALHQARSRASRMPDALIDAETTQLALAARRGDRDAFCALVDLHQRAARRVALAALGVAAEADEAVQDACLTAWQRIASLDDPAAFRAWLLRITWRKALDRRRSLAGWMKRLVERRGSGGRTGAAEDSEGRAGDLLLERVADDGALADAQLIARERDRVVADMIRSLPPRLRDPFLLAASGDHRYEDIAVMLTLPLGTVKWRVSEARRVLREKLVRVGFGSYAGGAGRRS